MQHRAFFSLPWSYCTCEGGITFHKYWPAIYRSRLFSCWKAKFGLNQITRKSLSNVTVATYRVTYWSIILSICPLGKLNLKKTVNEAAECLFCFIFNVHCVLFKNRTLYRCSQGELKLYQRHLGLRDVMSLFQGSFKLELHLLKKKKELNKLILIYIFNSWLSVNWLCFPFFVKPK